MEKLAERLESAADALNTVDRSLPAHAVPASVFGADDEGEPGRLGQALHQRWLAVLTARAHEAAAAATHLTELATDLRQTVKDYAETDDEAGRRLQRGK